MKAPSGALPSNDSAVTLTRADLVALLEGATDDVNRSRPRDLTVEEVAEEMQRSPSAVRRWLIAGDLRGYKLNGKSWRVPRSALETYRARQAGELPESLPENDQEVDIGAWRKLRELGRSQPAHGRPRV
jgi:excisionase family DNA binding protein